MLCTLAPLGTVDGFRGSTTGTPSTTNVYRYGAGGSGPTVTDQTPRLFGVIGTRSGTRLRPHSPCTITTVAFGASSRNVTRPSDSTSGDSTTAVDSVASWLCAEKAGAAVAARTMSSQRTGYFANGSGRIWNFTTSPRVPLPPSMCHTAFKP